MAVTINRNTKKTDHTDLDMSTTAAMRQGSTKTCEVTDARGRRIVLKRPNPIAKLRFIKALGEDSMNRLYVGSVSPLMYVASIDGVAIMPINANLEIDALYSRLDEDGMEAVTSGLAEFINQIAGVDVETAKK